MIGRKADKERKGPVRKEGWWRRNINWHLMRAFGQSAPATLTIAAPFIGYAILYHESIEVWLGGLGGFLDAQSVGGQCKQVISFAGRLNYLYCGILVLGMGTLFFRFFAPSEVKASKSISDYVNQNIDLVTAMNLRSMFLTISSRRSCEVDLLLLRAPWLEDGVSLVTASDALKQDGTGSIKIDVLHSYFRALDRDTSRWALYVVGVSFLIGFSLLAIPSFFFTLRVLCVVYGSSGEILPATN